MKILGRESSQSNLSRATRSSSQGSTGQEGRAALGTTMQDKSPTVLTNADWERVKKDLLQFFSSYTAKNVQQNPDLPQQSPYLLRRFPF